MRDLAWSETYRQAGVVLATLAGLTLSVIIVLGIYAYQQDQLYGSAPTPVVKAAQGVGQVWLDVPPLEGQAVVAPLPIDVQPVEEEIVEAPVEEPEPSLSPQTAPQELPTPMAEPDIEPAPALEPAPAPEVEPAPALEPESEPAPESEPVAEPVLEPAPIEPASAPVEEAEEAPAAPLKDVFVLLLGGGDNPRLLDALPSGTGVVLGVIDEDTAAFVAKAHSKGIKIYLPLPVAESGPLPSLAAEPEENRQRFITFLKQLPPVDGLYIPEGHPFNKDMASFATLLGEAKAQGLNVIGTIPPNLQSPTTPLPAHHAVNGTMLPGDAGNMEGVLFVLTSDRAGVTVITGPADVTFANALAKARGYAFTAPEGF